MGKAKNFEFGLVYRKVSLCFGGGCSKSLFKTHTLVVTFATGSRKASQVCWINFSEMGLGFVKCEFSSVSAGLMRIYLILWRMRNLTLKSARESPLPLGKRILWARRWLLIVVWGPLRSRLNWKLPQNGRVFAVSTHTTWDNGFLWGRMGIGHLHPPPKKGSLA